MLARLLTTMLLLLIGLAGCNSAPSPLQRAEFTRLCMGVQTRIVLYAQSSEIARNSAAAAFDRIADLEQVMSDYRPDSELMRLCAAPAGTPVPLSPDLYDVLRLSQQLCEASDGAFDITIGPAVALWRCARQTHQLPTTDELAAARALIGPALLTLDATTSPPTATLAKPGMKLDLGGIGKGYAAQAAVDLLRARGQTRCLVALSGDIALGDPPPDTPGWTIDLPVTPSPHHPLTLSRCAISTSGATEQYIEINGQRYAHILDPHTGLGLTECRTATVIAPRGEISDALGTIATILPPDRFRVVLARYPGSRLVAPNAISTATPPPSGSDGPDHLPRRGPGPIAR